jgi:hypothetical protein
VLESPAGRFSDLTEIPVAQGTSVSWTVSKSSDVPAGPLPLSNQPAMRLLTGTTVSVNGNEEKSIRCRLQSGSSDCFQEVEETNPIEVKPWNEGECRRPGDNEGLEDSKGLDSFLCRNPGNTFSTRAGGSSRQSCPWR